MSLKRARAAGLTVALAMGCGPQPKGDGGDAGSTTGEGTTEGSTGNTEPETQGDPDFETSVGSGEPPPHGGSCPLPEFEGATPVPESQMASTMAAEYCIAVVDCACSDRSHETVPSCRHSENMGWEDLRERAEELELVYDGSCLGQLIAGLRTLGCGPSVEGFETLLAQGGCSVYWGGDELGDPCETAGAGVSTCISGLACWDGICVDPCAAGAEAGPRSRPFNFPCGPGEASKYGDCFEPSRVGEECNQGCEAGAYCRDGVSRTCEFLVPDGEPCDEDIACASGMCSAAGGVCVVGPVSGEPCLEGRCAGNRQCEGGICGAAEPAICMMTP